MTRLILSTSNALTGRSPIAQLASQEKSNVELTSSLKANLLEAQEDAIALLNKQNHIDPLNGARDSSGTSLKILTNGTANGSSSVPLSAWTDFDKGSNTLYIPDRSHSGCPLKEEPESYNITVKLFYLPSLTAKSRSTATSDALSLVRNSLKVPSVELLILSFPHITFEDEEVRPEVDCYGFRVVNGTTSSAPLPEPMENIIASWQVLESLVDQGLAKCIGVAEFGTARLKELIAAARIKPAVNQVNLRNSCDVPRELVRYAKSEGVKILTHNDCTDILPAGTMRELLGPGDGGAGVLAARGPAGEAKGEGLRGEIVPQWVVKYTALVENTGVLENKGYFAAADLHEP